MDRLLRLGMGADVRQGELREAEMERRRSIVGTLTGPGLKMAGQKEELRMAHSIPPLELNAAPWHKDVKQRNFWGTSVPYVVAAYLLLGAGLYAVYRIFR